MFSFVALCSLRVGTHERKSARCRQSSANKNHSRVPLIRFQKSRGLSSIASSRPITHRARSTSRATSREIPRARARRDINLFTRARALSHPSRASPPPRATTRHPSSRPSIGRPRPSVSRINRWMQTRDLDRARATRDARNAPVDIDVKRFLSHRRHDRRNRSDRRARVLLTTRVETTGCMTTREAPDRRDCFFSVPSVRKVVRFKRVYTTTLVWMCSPDDAPAIARSHTFRAVLSGNARVTFRWVLCVYSWMCSPCVRILTSPTSRGVFFFF